MPPDTDPERAGEGAVARLFYPSPLITAPSVMIVEVPARYRGAMLPLGRYYPIIVETDVERDEVEQALVTGWRDGTGVALLDHRPSNLWSDRVLISRYDPPARGWPWVSVARWPDRFREVAADHGVEMARGCYTMELFATASELESHSATLVKGLGSQYPISVRMLSADSLPPGGIA